MNSFSLTAIPLFILMAEIISTRAELQDLSRLSKLVCVIPGGLLQTNIAGSHFRGDLRLLVATAAAIARDCPAATPPAWLGSPAVGGFAAAGGTLRIPGFRRRSPSIVYGTFTETSCRSSSWRASWPGPRARPALFMAYVVVHALLKPKIAPREAGPRNVAEFAGALSTCCLSPSSRVDRPELDPVGQMPPMACTATNDQPDVPLVDAAESRRLGRSGPAG